MTEPLTARRRAIDGVDPLAPAIGLLAGLALAARTFGGSLLLNWDQVIGPIIAVPPGQTAAGLELPRRVPFYTVLAPISRVVPGPAVVGLVLVLSVLAAVVGVVRLCDQPVDRLGSRPSDGGGDRLDERGLFRPMALALGLAYGLSPFLLTRAAVGHLPLVVAAALLPWAVMSLERRPWPSALGWSALFAFTGSSGAVLGLVPIGLAVVVAHDAGERRRPAVVAGRLMLVVAAQSIWLVPGFIAVARGVPLPETDSAAFATQVDGLGGWLRLVVGGGFFVGSEDVAARAARSAAALAAALLILAGFALIGRRTAADLLAKAPIIVWSAVIGLLLVVAPVVPGLSRLFAVASDSGPLVVIREPQKFWPLLFLGLVALIRAGVGGAGLAGLGGAVLTEDRARPNQQALLAMAALFISGLTLSAAWPGLWGAQRRLVSFDQPAAWSEITQTLEDDDGTVVVFPWRRYDRLDLSEGRNVLQPVPWLVVDGSADRVLTSGDPGLGPNATERAAPSSVVLGQLDVEVRGGRAIGPRLQELGVRWVLVAGSPDARFYRRLANEPELTASVEIDNFLLYRVDASTISAGSGALDRPGGWLRALAIAAAAPSLLALRFGGLAGRRGHNSM